MAEPEKEKKEKNLHLLSIYCTTWLLNHIDSNMMAAYQRVATRAQLAGLYLYLHLHFVAPAKHRQPKSPRPAWPA